MKPRGLLFFHQGWTDIFNSLGLISWYLKTYETLTVLIRMDAIPLMDFYCMQFGDRVELDFRPKELLDRMCDFSGVECDLLLHGINDIFRTDDYKNAYVRSNEQIFVNTFYTFYDIPAETRISHFQIERDVQLEEEKYNQFVQHYGTHYRLAHFIKPLSSEDSTLQTVDLNQTSDNFFDSIQILQNAKEFHLVDSSWAALVYLLDTKYGLFQSTPVHIYCARKYIEMFSNPVKLPNWTLHILSENNSM